MGNIKTNCKVLFSMAALLACVMLVSCATAGPSALPRQGDGDSMEIGPPTINKSAMYQKGEGIRVGAMVENRVGDDPGGEEVERFYPQITCDSQLPDGISISDFFPGYVEESSRKAMQERLGFSYDEEGNLPVGYSYVVVTSKVKNLTDQDVKFDSGWGSFAILDDDEGHYTPVGTNEPLWRDGWDGANAKQYFMIPLAPHEEMEVSTLYAVADADLDDPNLIFIADNGYGSGAEGIVGIKAFDVASQLQ